MKVDYRSLAQERTRTEAGTFARGVTIGKVERDAATMKEKALYVIELDSKGNVLKHYSNPPFHKLLDCIVVLAPAQFQGVRVAQAVALEIGLSRFVPYKATEVKSFRPNNKKQCKVVRERQHVGVLPWKVTEKLLSTLWLAIQICVDQKMEHWTKARLIQDPIEDISKSRPRNLVVYEAWITIRIPKDYPLIHAILRLKDEADRTKIGKNYTYVAEIIRREFNLFRNLKAFYKGDYPDEVLKKSNILYSLAGWIKKNIQFRGYTMRSVNAIRTLLQEKNSADVTLFDDMCRVFKVPKAPPDIFLDTCEPLLGNKKAQLVEGCSLRPCRVYKYEKKRKVHAQECFTIAIIGGREHMEWLDARNTRNRLKATEDSDIPL